MDAGWKQEIPLSTRVSFPQPINMRVPPPPIWERMSVGSARVPRRRRRRRSSDDDDGGGAGHPSRDQRRTQQKQQRRALPSSPAGVAASAAAAGGARGHVTPVRFFTPPGTRRRLPLRSIDGDGNGPSSRKRVTDTRRQATLDKWLNPIDASGTHEIPSNSSSSAIPAAAASAPTSVPCRSPDATPDLLAQAVALAEVPHDVDLFDESLQPPSSMGAGKDVADADAPLPPTYLIDLLRKVSSVSPYFASPDASADVVTEGTASGEEQMSEAYLAAELPMMEGGTWLEPLTVEQMQDLSLEQTIDLPPQPLDQQQHLAKQEELWQWTPKTKKRKPVSQSYDSKRRQTLVTDYFKVMQRQTSLGEEDSAVHSILLDPKDPVFQEDESMDVAEVMSTD